ncbi:Ankyrin repeat-containing protein [Quillaja saponaria]|uniref:Ankyrin repeat-containing protein n=1 Tax=Quillaja saponaria TaxID=32244 RepID=A0AAD7M4W6_QUISA|nr:Ankyrin repeat-containing protein [Quillaja saponaria]
MSTREETRVNIIEEPRTKIPNESKTEERDQRRRLYIAAVNNKWVSAADIFTRDPHMLDVPLTLGGDTALHVATSSNSTDFVLKLLQRLQPKSLEIRNRNGDTSFCLAAVSGNRKVVRVMVEKNPQLPWIRGNKDLLPMHMAAKAGNHIMVLFLYNIPKDVDRLLPEDIVGLFFMSITSSMYAVALRMLEDDRKLATSRDEKGFTVLHVLALKPLEEFSAHQFLLQLWKEILQLENEKILELITKPSVVLFDAVKSGNFEFLELLLEFNPDLLLRYVNDLGQNFLHVAVSYRQESTFTLILNKLGAGIGWILDDVDEDGNNILHYAGKLPPPDGFDSSSRPNLQMQQEVSWYKKVEKIVPALGRNVRNKDGKTPSEVFDAEHKELAKEGERAAKETADKCMLVATLVATIVFAAALTVPGARQAKDGWFITFILSNAVALFFSVTSIILFLFILSSSFTETETIKRGTMSMWGQTRLRWGFITLFVSLVSMVIAFTAATFLIYDHQSTWVAYVIAALACVPVILFLFFYLNVGPVLIRSYVLSKNAFQKSKCN